VPSAASELAAADPPVSEGVSAVKQFRFRAVVTFDATASEGPARRYPSGTLALMVHTRQPGHADGDSYFPAVITRDDEQPLPTGTHALVTITLTSQGTQAPLTSGELFALWAGDDIGHGIISRQVYTAFGPS